MQELQAELHAVQHRPRDLVSTTEVGKLQRLLQKQQRNEERRLVTEGNKQINH